MANPFTGVAQMGIDDFYAGLQSLASFGNQIKADLEADRTDLMNLYTTARNNPDPATATAQMAALDPLVHNNSSLRMQYQDLVSRFNSIVSQISSSLSDAGYDVPTLSGLGVAPLIVLGVVLAAAVAAWGIAEAIRAATDAQRTSTASLASIIANPSAYTPAAVTAAANALAQNAKNANPDPLGLGSIGPILGIAAVLLLAPSIVGMLRSRKAAA